MLARQKQVIASFDRVRGWLNRNPLPDAPAKYPERRAELDEVVARLNALLRSQEGGQREVKDDTKRQETARKTLREKHLAPLSRRAKAVLPDEAEIQKSMEMPIVNLATAKLITVAGAMRDTAAKYEQLFVENGRPADFLAKLDAAIEAVRQTVLVKAQNVGRHVGAKEGLKQELRRARRCVRMLDAMVLDVFAGRADVIADWRVSKRVKETTGSSFRGTGGTADENLEPQKAA